MALTLPTVKLCHKTKTRDDGRPLTRIVNQTDYARNIGAWKDWRQVSLRDGDAPEEVVRNDSREAKLNQHRHTDPAESRKRGDARRAQEARSDTTTNIVTEPQPPAPSVAVPSAVDRAAERERILGLQWFARVAEVERLTGTKPAKAADAKALLDAWVAAGQ